MENGGHRGFMAGGEVVLAPTEYEWGIRRVGRGRGELRENHVSVWDALVFGFFEQKMGRACLKFGEVQTLPPS